MIDTALLLTLPFAQGAILLDGRCNEPDWTKAAEIRMEIGARVLMLHDRDHVYFCAAAAPEAGTALDIYLRESDRTAQLHVSAQVGERLLDGTNEPPWNWNNHWGWYGTPTPLVALERGPDGRTRARYLQASHRETAVSKSRFGPLPWKFRVSVTSFGDGEARTAEFPVGTTVSDSVGWGELRGEGAFSAHRRLDRIADPDELPCPARRPIPC